MRVLKLFFLIALPVCLSAQTSKAIKTVTETSMDSKLGIPFPYKSQVTTYDQKGNVIDDIQYKSDGTVDKHQSFKYDSKNNKIEEVDYLPDGKLDKKTVYTYDAYGNKTEKSTYDALGKLKNQKKFSYTYYE